MNHIKPYGYVIELRAVILRNVGLDPNGLVGDFRFLAATAPQRCEAFLRMHWKWRTA